jgi:hypothetical protein
LPGLLRLFTGTFKPCPGTFSLLTGTLKPSPGLLRLSTSTLKLSTGIVKLFRDFSGFSLDFSVFLPELSSPLQTAQAFYWNF